jgi:hypothetical protein
MTDTHIIQTLLEQDFDLRSYSGRGMYGKQCLAVTGATLGEVVAVLVSQAIEKAEDILNKGLVYDVEKAAGEIKTDSLGMGIVVYFPSVPYNDDGLSSNDDEEESDED